MDLQIAGKSVLITGSTSGIGFAAAEGFAREGAAVIVNGRDKDRTEQACSRLQDAVPGASVRAIAADVGTVPGIERLIDLAPDVDVLVNNAGIFFPKPFADITEEDWQHIFEVNVMSGVRLCRHHLARMLARDEGRIIFVSSESAVQVAVDMLHYSMTKVAQLSLSRGLAELTQGTGVTVNTVLAGPTRTEGLSAYLEFLAEKHGVPVQEVDKLVFSTGRPSSLLQRYAKPSEIANMINYIASPRAAATNGAALRAEGGVLRSIV
jgi:NAD(P)-dependent dehydrogenase (short-subunit alcohol dehydrogenase family)